jgi:CheY-like chemotaxis protein/anti-sigma regulatory factor (Ser/Thr protein kinase)
MNIDTRPDLSALILLVDDVAQNLQLMGSLLHNAGYEVLPCQDGPSALRLAESRQPMLVLLDLLMPGMDGIEVCRRLKQNPATADIPVLFLTAVSEAAKIVEAFEAGALDVISKPCETPELLARIHTHVTLKETWTRLQSVAGERNRLVHMLATDLHGGDPAWIKHWARSLAALIELEESPKRFKFDSHPVSALLDESVAPCLSSARAKEISIEYEAGAQISIRTDKQAFIRILGIVLDNAVIYSPAGSVVRLGHRCENDRVVVWVADQGPGLQAHERPLLFEKFVRLGPAPTGGEPAAGLGLALAHLLAESLQASIRVESVPGHGSTFEISFPLGS